MKAFCCSVNVHGVVVLCSGGGDTWTLFVLTKLFDLFAPRGGGEQKTRSNCMGTRPCTLTTLGTRPCTLTTLNMGPCALGKRPCTLTALGIRSCAQDGQGSQGTRPHTQGRQGNQGTRPHTQGSWGGWGTSLMPRAVRVQGLAPNEQPHETFTAWFLHWWLVQSYLIDGIRVASWLFGEFFPCKVENIIFTWRGACEMRLNSCEVDWTLKWTSQQSEAWTRWGAGGGQSGVGVGGHCQGCTQGQSGRGMWYAGARVRVGVWRGQSEAGVGVHSLELGPELEARDMWGPEWGGGCTGPDGGVVGEGGGLYLVSHLPYLVYSPLSGILSPLSGISSPYLVSHLPYLVCHSDCASPRWRRIELVNYCDGVKGITFHLYSSYSSFQCSCHSTRFVMVLTEE